MDLSFLSKETLNPKPSFWESTLLWLSFPYFNFIGEPDDLDYYSHGLLYWEIWDPGVHGSHSGYKTYQLGYFEASFSKFRNFFNFL
jgi:hypothetical protein